MIPCALVAFLFAMVKYLRKTNDPSFYCGATVSVSEGSACHIASHNWVEYYGGGGEGGGFLAAVRHFLAEAQLRGFTGRAYAVGGWVVQQWLPAP